MYISFKPLKNFLDTCKKTIPDLSKIKKPDKFIAVLGIVMCVLIGILVTISFNIAKILPESPTSKTSPISENTVVPNTPLEKGKVKLATWLTEMKNRGWIRNNQGTSTEDMTIGLKFGTKPLFYGDKQIDMVVFNIKLNSEFCIINLYHDTNEPWKDPKTGEIDGTACRYVDNIYPKDFFTDVTEKPITEAAKKDLDALLEKEGL